MTQQVMATLVSTPVRPGQGRYQGLVCICCGGRDPLGQKKKTVSPRRVRRQPFGLEYMSETVSSHPDIVRADKEECNLSSEHGENCPRGLAGKKKVEIVTVMDGGERRDLPRPA